MPQRRNKFFLALLCLTGWASFCIALTTKAAEPSIEVRALTEIGSDPVPPMILEVDYDGLPGQGIYKNSKFFAMSAEFERGVVDGNGGRMGMPALNIVIVPVSREIARRQLPGDHEAVFSREMLKMQYRREANLGLAGSFSIYPLGGVWEINSRLAMASQLGRFSKFYELAVDLVGLGFLATMEGGALPNIQVGNVVFDAGISWNFTQLLDIRISLGADAHAGLGPYKKLNGENPAALGALSSVSAELAVGMKALGAHIAAFAVVEYQRFDLFGRFQNPGLDETLIRVGLKGDWQ